MATVANPFDTNNSNADGQPGQPVQGQNTNPTLGGQSGVAGTSGTTNPNAPQSNPGSSSSGSFQNLSKYINANKGFNAENGGLAGTVAGNINNQAQQTQQNVQGAQNLFNTQAQQNVSGFNNGDAVQQAVADPYAFTQNNPEGTQKVIAAENAQYTGPKGFQDLQGQNSLANLSIQNSNINNLADQTKSQSGQYNLLRQMFGTPSYTGGQQNLDQLIMNNAPGAQNQFAAARQQAANTNQALGASQQQAQQQAAQNSQLATKVQTDTRAALNNAVGSTNTAIGQEVTDAQKANDAYIQKVITDFKNGKLSTDEYNSLGGANSGLTSGMGTYNVDPTQFITNSLAPTAQQVATTGDYNKIAALNQLMGGGAVANEDSSKILQSFGDATQAGKYDPNTAQFNGGGYNQSVGTANAAINKQLEDFTSANRTAQQQTQDAIAHYLALHGNNAENDDFYHGLQNTLASQVNAYEKGRNDINAKRGGTLQIGDEPVPGATAVDPTMTAANTLPRLGGIMKGNR